MALRKRGVTFLICFKKRGYSERVGFPQKRGGSNPEGNYVICKYLGDHQTGNNSVSSAQKLPGMYL